MSTIQAKLVEAIFNRIKGRMWKKLSPHVFNAFYAKEAAVRFLEGNLNHNDIYVLGLPQENAGSEMGARRWLISGLGDKHISQIDAACGRKTREHIEAANRIAKLEKEKTLQAGKPRQKRQSQVGFRHS